MAAVFRRRVNVGKMAGRLILILIIILLVLNFDSIGRIIYRFPYKETTISCARAYNVDPFLLAAMMKTESDFDSRAISASGARGLMQIMPDTGQWVAGQLSDTTFNPDRLFVPETSIKYGAWYLADLEKEFGGDPVLALAAYNGGRGNVKDWVSSKSLSVGKSTIDQIPFPETRHYVRKVLIRQKIYSHLYGRETTRLPVSF